MEEGKRGSLNHSRPKGLVGFAVAQAARCIQVAYALVVDCQATLVCARALRWAARPLAAKGHPWLGINGSLDDVHVVKVESHLGKQAARECRISATDLFGNRRADFRAKQGSGLGRAKEKDILLVTACHEMARYACRFAGRMEAGLAKGPQDTDGLISMKVIDLGEWPDGEEDLGGPAAPPEPPAVSAASPASPVRRPAVRPARLLRGREAGRPVAATGAAAAGQRAAEAPGGRVVAAGARRPAELMRAAAGRRPLREQVLAAHGFACEAEALRLGRTGLERRQAARAAAEVGDRTWGRQGGGARARGAGREEGG